MLTEADKKWLKKREYAEAVEYGHYSCPSCKWLGQEDNVCIFRRCLIFDPNWQDAAEFEARVAASIAQDAYNCAQDEMLFQHQEGDRPQGWYILRDARLVVEEEMENGRTI